MHATIVIQRCGYLHRQWFILYLNVNGKETHTGFFVDLPTAFHAATSVTDALKLAGCDVAPVLYDHGE